MLYPLPKDFGAVFGCAFSAETTDEHGDLLDDFSRIVGAVFW
jgi:hypothetical protein